jgi:uncharacterized repeat protein (TIGR03803 family)
MKVESTSATTERVDTFPHPGKPTKQQWYACAMAFAIALTLEAFAGQSTQAQTFKVLHTFTGSPDGETPYAALVEDASGNLYGTTEAGGVSGSGAVFKVNSKGETVMYSFKGSSDGGLPYAGLLIDAAGNLYGTTYFGGLGVGTVFEVNGKGKETVLFSFDGTNGELPYAGLVMDAKGNLYGTTFAGGASPYLGTVFKLAKDGKETVLYSFCHVAGCTDGAGPMGGLVMDVKGNLFGTASIGGGTGENCSNGCGTVFKVSAAGKFGVLYSFKGSPDGGNPYAGLVRDKKGNLYGTTVDGGVSGCSSGCGTVFKVSTTGKESVLYRFTGGKDGGEPFAGLVMDANGNLYGTTAIGGANNLGTVFKLGKIGKETVLHSFNGKDGDVPTAGLHMDSAGNLYGTASMGGDFSCFETGCGTVFKLTP